MRKGWEYKKLGEVCKVINGYAFKSSKYTNKGTRIIRITNVQKGYVVDNDPKFYSDEDFKDLYQYSLFEGDLVMSLTGNVGRVGILQKDMLPAALNQRVACLRVKSEKMRLNYLFHLLNSNLFEIAAIQSARGIAQLNMSTEWLKNYIIPLPPPSTQLAIVSELDKINELIRLKKEQLKDFDNLAQSLFHEMFGDPVENEKGWEVKKLGEVCCIGTGSTPNRKNKEFYENGTYPWVKSTEVCNLPIYSVEEYITEEALKNSNCTLYPKNTILMAMYGQGKTRGQIGLLKIEACTNQAVAAIIPTKEVLDEIFLCQHLMLMYEHIRNMARGGNQANLNLSIVKSIQIFLPPLSLQRLFAQRIEQIEREKSEVQKSIQDLETLLASRMQYWFE